MVSRVVIDVAILSRTQQAGHLCQPVAVGSAANRLNLTLQLTTADFLPVSTLLHAAAQVWVSAKFTSR